MAYPCVNRRVLTTLDLAALIVFDAVVANLLGVSDEFRRTASCSAPHMEVV